MSKGLYSEVIRQRDETDRKKEQAADQGLAGKVNLRADDRDGGAQQVVHYILGRYGLHADEAYGCDTVESMLDLLLDPLGMMYDEVDLNDPTWMQRTELMLGFKKTGEAVALIPGVAGYCCLSASDNRKERIKHAEELSDRAYAIYRPLPKGNINPGHLVAYMLHMVSPRDFIMIVTAILAISLLGLVVPHMNSMVLNEVVPQGMDGIPVLLRCMILFLSAGIIKAGLSATKGIFLGRMKERIAGQTQAAVLGRLLLMPQSWFVSSSTGRLSKKLSNMRRLCDQILSFVLDSVLTAVFSLVYVMQMDRFSNILLLPAIVILLVRMVVSLAAGIAEAENEQNALEAETDAESFLYSAVKGVQTIKGSGAERRVYAKWAEYYRRVLQYQLNQPALLKLENVIVSFLSSLTTVILLGMVVPNGITGADYIAFVSAYGLVTAAIGQLMDSARRILLMKPMADSIRDLMRVHTEGDAGDMYLRKVVGNIRVDHVSFSYEGSRRSCLQDISFTVNRGEKIAIAGESGCGKSTLLKLLIGAIRPDAGEVFIDGKGLGTVNLRSYRRHIGSVFQFSKVIPGTIYSNVSFSPVPVSREEAEIAIEKAAISEYIHSLPMGLDTEVSESGSSGFSGGQRQRILLARAFASHPSIMILDEATSALDNLMQARVLESVYREKCTVIMVAHRLSTVTGCDRILMLENGRITEEGSFDELMEKNGAFACLVRKQQQSAWDGNE